VLARPPSRRTLAPAAALPGSDGKPGLDRNNLPGSKPDVWESELIGGAFKARCAAPLLLGCAVQSRSGTLRSLLCSLSAHSCSLSGWLPAGACGRVRHAAAAGLACGTDCCELFPQSLAAASEVNNYHPRHCSDMTVIPVLFLSSLTPVREAGPKHVNQPLRKRSEPQPQ